MFNPLEIQVVREPQLNSLLGEVFPLRVIYEQTGGLFFSAHLGHRRRVKTDTQANGAWLLVSAQPGVSGYNQMEAARSLTPHYVAAISGKLVSWT